MGNPIDDQAKGLTERPAWMNRSMRALIIGLVATCALTALDLWTKEVAFDTLSVQRQIDIPPVCAPDKDGFIRPQRLRSDRVVLIENYLEFRYAENCGAAFGLMHDAHPWIRNGVFGFAAVFASVLLFWMFFKGKGRVLFAWAVPLIVSGALGNLADRVRHGFVVDFIRFHIREQWEWPTFNVADAWITIGVAFMLIDGILESRYEARQRKAETASSQA